MSVDRVCEMLPYRIQSLKKSIQFNEETIRGFKKDGKTYAARKVEERTKEMYGYLADMNKYFEKCTQKENETFGEYLNET